MDTDTEYTLDRVYRLVSAATGEEYGDGRTVTDMGVGIVEPGYGDKDTVWVLGDWNPTRFPRGDEPPLTREENLGPRLYDALEKYAPDAYLDWCDEWVRCEHCYRIFRGQPDSYSWTMYGAYVEDAAGYVCAECFDIDTIEEHYANQPDNALTFPFDLEEHGYQRYNAERFESGWHPGQNDKPRDILARAHREGWDTGIFTIPTVGQFDIAFDLWVKSDAEEE